MCFTAVNAPNSWLGRFVKLEFPLATWQREIRGQLFSLFTSLMLIRIPYLHLVKCTYKDPLYCSLQRPHIEGRLSLPQWALSSSAPSGTISPFLLPLHVTSPSGDEVNSPPPTTQQQQSWDKITKVCITAIWIQWCI